MDLSVFGLYSTQCSHHGSLCLWAILHTMFPPCISLSLGCTLHNVPTMDLSVTSKKIIFFSFRHHASLQYRIVGLLTDHLHFKGNIFLYSNSSHYINLTCLNLVLAVTEGASLPPPALILSLRYNKIPLLFTQHCIAYLLAPLILICFHHIC